MVPTFQDNDYLITDKLSYEFTEPKKGDVVIVDLPNEDKLLIKRVIGLPGDTLLLEKGNENNNFVPSFSINGKIQSETYINEKMEIWDDFTYTVKANEVFVMGDNRNRSADSREYGPFPLDSIQGKVVLEIKDTLQFHTQPTVYILVFIGVVIAFLIYLFYPYIKMVIDRKHKKETR